jgi:ribosomal protein S3AE
MAIAKKRKKFFDVEIPLIKKETQSIAYAVEDLQGRNIKYDLTRILRGKGAILQAKIKIEKDKAVAHPKQLKIMPFYLKRMVRKGTNYVEDSFSTETKDSQIRIKPFLITRRKVSKAVRKALREKAREELIKYVKTKTTEELFQEILRNILQKTISLKLKKVYPLSLCEIRVLKVEKELEPKKETKKKE